MKVIQTFVIMGSIITCFVMQGHPVLSSTPSTSSNSTTQSLSQARLIYDTAKKAYDQATTYVRNCESNMESINNKCTLLKTQASRFKEKYEEISKELPHVKDYAQIQTLQKQSHRALLLGKKTKEEYATCETKTLAQAQMDLQDAKEREQSAHHRLEQAKELLAHTTEHSTTDHDTNHLPPIKPLPTNVSRTTQTPVNLQDTHGSDTYLFKPKNDVIDFDSLMK